MIVFARGSKSAVRSIANILDQIAALLKTIRGASGTLWRSSTFTGRLGYSTPSKAPLSALLVDNQKDAILRKMDQNRVVIIKGATGCGKSTGVPRMLLMERTS